MPDTTQTADYQEVYDKIVEGYTAATGKAPTGEALSEIGAYALTGAEIGTIIPGIGNVIGGIVGAVVGFVANFSSLFGRQALFGWTNANRLVTPMSEQIANALRQQFTPIQLDQIAKDLRDRADRLISQLEPITDRKTRYLQDLRTMNIPDPYAAIQHIVWLFLLQRAEYMYPEEDVAGEMLRRVKLLVTDYLQEKGLVQNVSGLPGLPGSDIQVPDAKALLVLLGIVAAVKGLD